MSEEEKIIDIIKNRNLLNELNISPTDVIKAVKMALSEFEELKEKIAYANFFNQSLESLCKELGGHNGEFDLKYPENNYFDVNYKSLLVTVVQELDENNKKQDIELSKSAVYIYPDNISNIEIDELFVLDFYDSIDFKKVEEALEFQVGDFVKDSNGIIGKIDFIESRQSKPYVVLFQDIDGDKGRWWCSKEDLSFATNKEIVSYKDWYKNGLNKQRKELNNVIATFKDDTDLKVTIVKTTNDKYFNRYYAGNMEYYNSTAGPFISEDEARLMVKKHRPTVKEIKNENVDEEELENKLRKRIKDYDRKRDELDREWNKINDLKPKDMDYLEFQRLLQEARYETKQCNLDNEMDKFIIMYDDKTCSCVDNTSGHLYIEDFNDIILGIRYLQGESIDKLRDEECKYEILIYETKEDYEQGEPFQHNVYSDLKSAKKELMDIVKFNNYYSGKVMDQKTDEELFSFETLESEEDEEIIQ